MRSLLLFLLSALFVTDTFCKRVSCRKGVKTCPDGSKVRRDLKKYCRFPKCDCSPKGWTRAAASPKGCEDLQYTCKRDFVKWSHDECGCGCKPRPADSCLTPDGTVVENGASFPGVPCGVCICDNGDAKCSGCPPPIPEGGVCKQEGVELGRCDSGLECRKTLRPGTDAAIHTCQQEITCANIICLVGHTCQGRPPVCVPPGGCLQKPSTVIANGSSVTEGCTSCLCRDGTLECTVSRCQLAEGDVCEVDEVPKGQCSDGLVCEFTDDPSEKRCQKRSCKNTACIATHRCVDLADGPVCVPIGQCVDDDGNFIESGDSFMRECNECFCEDGAISCTEIACLGDGEVCERRGVEQGQCNPGLVCMAESKAAAVKSVKLCRRGLTCANVLCLPAHRCVDLADGPVCVPIGQCVDDDGNFIESGDSFMRECNRCRCNRGMAACTKRACPKPRRCRKGVKTCPDGSKVRRDPKKWCRFPKCDCSPKGWTRELASPKECKDRYYTCKRNFVKWSHDECGCGCKPRPCRKGKRTCPDGSKVERDPKNKCRFPKCKCPPEGWTKTGGRRKCKREKPTCKAGYEPWSNVRCGCGCKPSKVMKQ